MSNGTHAEILALGARWADAEQHGDTATLDELSVTDFRLVGPFGFVLDKAQWLDRYRSGTLVTSSLVWDDVTVPGGPGELNQELERAGRVADFLELGELMCRDAHAREESCGCHFRVEHQTADGEAQRNDDAFAHVTVWTPSTPGRGPQCLVEPLSFETLPLHERSYR